MFGWMRKTWYASDNDAWKKLLALGYSDEYYTTKDGLRCYAFFKDGIQITDYSKPIPFDQRDRLRRLFAEAELKELKEDGELTA